MKARKLIATGVVVAALGAFGTATAVAADSEGQTVEFTVEAGNLLIDLDAAAPASSVLTAAGGLSFTADSTDFTGSLPETTITDARRSLGATWSVSVSASGDFSDGDGNTVPLANAEVTFPATDPNNLTGTLSGTLTGMNITAAYLGGGLESLETQYELVGGATTDLGLGETPSLSYVPAVTVAVPNDTPAGTYSTTVTQTLTP